MTRVFPVFCENKKKICFFRKKALDICAENSIIGLTLERDGDNARTDGDGGPERPPGSLKESEMCLVTAQENFLEVFLRKTGQTIKINEEFDPGSERTLVACLIHASRAR